MEFQFTQYGSDENSKTMEWKEDKFAFKIEG
jgi:hypothetical protein